MKIPTFLFLFLVLLLESFSQSVTTLTSVVQTKSGPVRGIILKTIENSKEYGAFRGIPYAKPPLKYSRFKPPVEKEAWTNVYNATSDGSICIQYNKTDSTVRGSEDCLFINVFTPHTNFNQSYAKPVMVWIHGGAYRTGNSNSTFYGPDFLLEQDVIVVSFNYRLGALGFMQLNHNNASGNYGLKDQNLALKWVQKNIASFGGDPKRVTLFGQSAGSVSVDLHMLSDMSTGLFNQTICMSGSTLCMYWGFQTSIESESVAFDLGRRLGKHATSKDELINFLYNAPAAEIVRKTNDIPLIPFRPTLESTLVAKAEGKFITECSVHKYKAGNYNKVTHMMGFTTNETLAFASNTSNYVDMANIALDKVKASGLDIDLPFLASIANRSSLAENKTIYRAIDETTDILFFLGIDKKQQLFSLMNKNPIYYYVFAFDSNYSMHRTDGVDLDGVAHEDELAYIFYRPAVKLPLNNPDIKITRQRMVRLWTNYAKYGNPTPEGESDQLLGITWPVSGISGKHLKINRNLSVGLRPINDRVRSYQTAGLGDSLILNECDKNILGPNDTVTSNQFT